MSAPAPTERKFRDQRVPLKLLGALSRFLALFLCCVSVVGAVVIPYGLFIDTESQVLTGNEALAAAILAPSAVVGLGVLSHGLLRLRRWVRPVMLIGLSFVFCASILLVAGGIAVMPAVNGFMQQFGMLLNIVWCFFQAAVAAAFFVYFSCSSVKKTLEVYDPQPRWTDHYPTPHLGITAATAILALLCASFSICPRLPFFGKLISGAPKIVLLYVLGSLFALAAVLQFRRKQAGLYLAAGTLILMQCSIIVSVFIRPTITTALAMGLNGRDLNPIKGSALFDPSFVAITSSVSTFSCVLYAYLCRGYFTPEMSQHDSSSLAEIK